MRRMLAGLIGMMMSVAPAMAEGRMTRAASKSTAGRLMVVPVAPVGGFNLSDVQDVPPRDDGRLAIQGLTAPKAAPVGLLQSAETAQDGNAPKTVKKPARVLILSGSPQDLSRPAEKGPLRSAGSEPLDVTAGSSGASDEALRLKAELMFEQASQRPILDLDPGPVTVGEPDMPSRPRRALRGLAALLPALALAGCQEKPRVDGALPPLRAIAESPLLRTAAEIGSLAGNGIAFVLDLPRLFAAAQTRDPKAVSVLSNVILMVASLLLAARGFLGLNLLWAWQNLFSGIVPMTIILLQFEKTRWWFPQGRAAADDKSESYPLGITLARTGLLLLIGGAAAGGLGLLGMVFLVPLGSAGFSALTQFLLQVVASTGFISFMIPQIRKVETLRSTEGLSQLFFYSLLALNLGLGLWAADNVLLQIRGTAAATLRCLDFWKFAIYLAQTCLSGFYTWRIIRVISELRKQDR